MLGALFCKADAWAQDRAGPRYNPLEHFMGEYPGWDELSLAFIDFLKTRSVKKWTKGDSSVVRNLVTLDGATERLLRSIPDNELFDLLTLPYPDQQVRLYMLVRARRVGDQTEKMRIAAHFFEHDDSGTVRDYALEMLARTKWSLTEHYVKIWWDSGDLVKRLVALNALLAAQSSQLPVYLDLAEKSDEKTLRTLSALPHFRNPEFI